MIKYSQTTNSFYDTALSADIPFDAVDVTPARHAEIMRELSNRGKTLSADPATGEPIVIDAAQPSLMELASFARQQRNRLLAESDWVVVRACEINAPIPENWKTYRKALRDLPKQPGFPTEINWPALQG